MNRYLEKFKEIPRGVRLSTVVTLEWATAVQDALRALAQGENISVEGEVTRNPGDGKVRLGARRRFIPRGRGAVVGVDCAFGQIIDIPDSDPVKKGIRGGVIYPDNWNMDPQELNLAASGVWLVSLAVDCIINRDDDEVIPLPGLKEATKPTGAWTKTAWSEGTDYPASKQPDATSGAGTIVIPLGKLTIAGGAAKFEAAGCGNITLTHCAGTLGHARG